MDYNLTGKTNKARKLVFASILTVAAVLRVFQKSL